ncbi:hypothetical protein AVEN_144521-1 [Araneus ventricosus]|uniref:Uncharacterized protein n=1 Tax=Araneus ventricosus TaxID=182803 RepID=A0A4Y2W4N2_ARAVE|nr:hypothetical protein AVEN_144521-1 [Araneus ventricosus]
MGASDASSERIKEHTRKESLAAALAIVSLQHGHKELFERLHTKGISCSIIDKCFCAVWAQGTLRSKDTRNTQQERNLLQHHWQNRTQSLTLLSVTRPVTERFHGKGKEILFKKQRKQKSQKERNIYTMFSTGIFTFTLFSS